MRQLFTWRFVAVIAALAGLVLFVAAVVADDDELAAVIEPDVLDRRMDLIAGVSFTDSSDDFEIGRDGLTQGFIDFTLDDLKVLRVAPGTAGEIDCDITLISQCVVFVDLLGDAVIWFAVLPGAERNTAELPPIIDLEDGYALFENGWQIAYPPVIDRRCEGEDIVSFSDFLDRFGPGSITVVDVETQQVVRVRCSGEDRVEITTTTEAPIVAAPGDGEPGDEIDENDGVAEVPVSVEE